MPAHLMRTNVADVIQSHRARWPAGGWSDQDAMCAALEALRADLEPLWPRGTEWDSVAELLATVGPGRPGTQPNDFDTLSRWSLAILFVFRDWPSSDWKGGAQ